MELEVLFYRKLNEYYELRDRLFTIRSIRGHAYSIIDFLVFVILGVMNVVASVVLAIIEGDISYVCFLSILYIPLFIVAFIIFKERKNKLEKLQKMKEEILCIGKQDSKLLENKRFELIDYINELASFGFGVECTKNKNKTIYLLRSSKCEVKVTTLNTFFINKLDCEINGVNFKKCLNENKNLMQLIKDYKFDALFQNYYQMIEIFYKYILETLEEYL